MYAICNIFCVQHKSQSQKGSKKLWSDCKREGQREGEGEREQEWGQAELKHTSITSPSPNATFRWDNEMSGKKVVEFAVFDILQKMIGFIWMRTRRAHDRGAMQEGEGEQVAGSRIEQLKR